MRGAEKTYAGQLKLEVVEGSPASLKDQMEPYGFEGGHGLVALAPDGTMITKVDGHTFGRTDESAQATIEKVAAQVLK